MRRWGVLVTIFYTIVVLALFAPGIAVLAGESWSKAYADAYRDSGGAGWIWVVMLIAGQALLLVRVDRSGRRLRPRTRVAVTATAMGAATAILAFGIAVAPLAAIYGDKDWPADLDDILFNYLPAIWLGLWAVWGVVFYVFYRRSPERMASAIRWLIAGSVLDLLIAVPAHVIVRRRHDCSAPGVTAYGIVTGTAVMLMCFGPSVFALYQQRRERYRAEPGGRARGGAPAPDSRFTG